MAQWSWFVCSATVSNPAAARIAGESCKCSDCPAVAQQRTALLLLTQIRRGSSETAVPLVYGGLSEESASAGDGWPSSRYQRGVAGTVGVVGAPGTEVGVAAHRSLDFAVGGAAAQGRARRELTRRAGSTEPWCTSWIQLACLVAEFAVCVSALAWRDRQLTVTAPAPPRPCTSEIRRLACRARVDRVGGGAASRSEATRTALGPSRSLCLADLLSGAGSRQRRDRNWCGQRRIAVSYREMMADDLRQVRIGRSWFAESRV